MKLNKKGFFSISIIYSFLLLFILLLLAIIVSYLTRFKLLDDIVRSVQNEGVAFEKEESEDNKWLANVIKKKAPTSTGTINDEGLMKLEQQETGQTPAQTEYRFSSKNPKNYIKFNNETWRILGVFSTDDGTGTYENRVKIVLNFPLTDKKTWNGVENDSNHDEESIWQDSTLKTYLNGEYYNNLTSTSKNQISVAKWYVRPIGSYDSGVSAYINLSTLNSYINERQSDKPLNRITNWNGKIALINVSDYGYASGNCYSSDTFVSNYNNDICVNSNWIYRASDQQVWLMNPVLGAAKYAWTICTDGHVQTSGASVDTNFSIRPALYLKKDVVYVEGTGTSSDPYIIQ